MALNGIGLIGTAAVMVMAVLLYRKGKPQWVWTATLLLGWALVGVISVVDG